MQSISLICPLYNSSNKFESLKKVISIQKDVVINDIIFPVTKSNDNTKEIFGAIKNAKLVDVEKFSHSLTRERYIKQAINDIVILITDDIETDDCHLFYKLSQNIKNGFAISFARQVARHKHIEKYIREINYPAESYVVDKGDIDKKGLNAFFCSDVCMAYNKEIFLKLNGYDELDLPSNEDMYYARKVLINGYQIKYDAEAIVIHSHKGKLKTLYKRYYDTGKTFAKCPELKQYNSSESGLSLALKVLIKIFKHFDLIALLMFIPNMFVRYLGKKLGENKDENKSKKVRISNLLLIPILVLCLIYVCFINQYATSNGYIGLNPIIYSILFAFLIGMLVPFFIYQIKYAKLKVNKVFATLFLLLIIENSIVVLCQGNTAIIDVTIRSSSSSLIPEMIDIFKRSGIATPSSLEVGQIYSVVVDTSLSYKFYGIFVFAVQLIAAYILIFVLPQKIGFKKGLKFLYFLAIVFGFILIVSSYIMDASSYRQIFENFFKKEMFEVLPPPCSFLGQHNIYGLVLVLAMLVVMFKNLEKNHWWNWLFIVFIFFNILLSLSKGSIIASIIFIFGYLVIFIYKIVNNSRKGKIYLFSITGVVAGGVIIVLLTSLLLRGSILPSIYNSLVNSRTMISRYNIWQNVVQLLNQNCGWLFGRGFTLNSRMLYPMNTLNGDVVFTAHNGYLQMLLYGGIPMLIIFILLIAYFIKVSLKTFKSEKYMTLLCYITAFGFLILSIVEMDQYLVLCSFVPVIYSVGKEKHI